MQTFASTANRSNTTSTSELTIDGLILSRQQQHLLSLSATIRGGEILTIMGPSGSGKSTLLNWLTGMLPAGFSAEGQLHLNGQNITTKCSTLNVQCKNGQQKIFSTTFPAPNIPQKYSAQNIQQKRCITNAHY